MMLNKPKRLTYSNREIFFEQKFLDNELCVYDPNYYLWDCVKKLSRQYNVDIEYCEPGSYGYKINGCFCFVVNPKYVVARLINEISTFDIQELDLPVS
jgi:hypothetical protein